MPGARLASFTSTTSRIGDRLKTLPPPNTSRPFRICAVAPPSNPVPVSVIVTVARGTTVGVTEVNASATLTTTNSTQFEV